ncbi:MAG: hypothetical protein ABIG61_11485, partial [Planctomycetota bacterium]
DTYATCMKYCSQDTCRLSCIRGLDGCLKRCRGREESYLPTESPVQLAEINCVCAECGYKCGTGHATTCSSYQEPKANTPIARDTVAQHSTDKGESQNIDNASPRLAEGSQLCCYTYNMTAIVARCPQSKPYFNSQNGECYSTKSTCKEASGGYDFCQLCTRCP